MVPRRRPGLVVDENPGAVRPLHQPVDDPFKRDPVHPHRERHLAVVADDPLHQRGCKEPGVEVLVLSRPVRVHAILPEHHGGIAAAEDLVDDETPGQRTLPEASRATEVSLDLARRVDTLPPIRWDTRRNLRCEKIVRHPQVDRGGLLHFDRDRRRIECERDAERTKDGLTPGVDLIAEPETVREPGHPDLSMLRDISRHLPAEDQVILCPGDRDIEEPFTLRALLLPVLVFEEPEDGRLFTLVIVCRVRYRDTEQQPLLHHDRAPAGPWRLRKVREDDDRELKPLCGVHRHDRDRIGRCEIEGRVPLTLRIVDGAAELRDKLRELIGTSRDGDQLLDVRYGLFASAHTAEENRDPRGIDDPADEAGGREPAGEQEPIAEGRHRRLRRGLQPLPEGAPR